MYVHDLTSIISFLCAAVLLLLALGLTVRAKFSTDLGALSGFNSIMILPRLVLISTCGSAAKALKTVNRTARSRSLAFIWCALRWFLRGLGCVALVPYASGTAFIKNPPAGFFT